ncbi:MAG: GT4 family glycosyltransferase PelF, partial [Mariprofundaceae bacterium]
VSLYEGNRQRQIQDGAQAAKTCVIPNGIRVERFLEARRSRSREVPHVAGLVGRVVPIKDIKTFIRAMHVVCASIPDAEGWIVGPDNEDPEYAEECRSLARNMGLGEKIKFLGMQKVDEIFPKLGVNVLTSISEALPLVLLEGFASGVPAVATEVGACHELVYGSGAEDEAIGAAGEVVSIANPDATGAAIISLLSDPEHWRRAQPAGIDRVEGLYTEAMLFDAYRNLYRDMMDDSNDGESQAVNA